MTLKIQRPSHLLLSKEGDTAVEAHTSRNLKEKLQANVSQAPVDILHRRPFAFERSGNMRKLNKVRLIMNSYLKQ